MSIDVEPEFRKSPPSQDELIEMIARDIYRGKLAPGMWLKQIDLEQRYGCARLSLRHALEQLSSRKLVEKLQNRGYHVPDFDISLVREIADARARVEMSIAEDLVSRATDEGLARMTELASEYEKSVYNGTIDEQDRMNFAFHGEMLKASPNPIITDIIWSLRRRVPLSIQREINTPARLEISARQHFAMIDAIRAGDARTLQSIISDHIRSHYAPRGGKDPQRAAG